MVLSYAVVLMWWHPAVLIGNGFFQVWECDDYTGTNMTTAVYFNKKLEVIFSPLFWYFHEPIQGSIRRLSMYSLYTQKHDQWVTFNQIWLVDNRNQNLRLRAFPAIKKPHPLFLPTKSGLLFSRCRIFFTFFPLVNSLSYLLLFLMSL